MHPTVKNIIVLVSAGVAGGIIASLTSVYIPQKAEAASSELRATSFVLVNATGLAAARLGIIEGQTVLQFYNEDSTVALEVGVQQARHERFVHFFGPHRQNLVALNTLESGDSTLSLGSKLGVRLLLGAIPLSDVFTTDPASVWGMMFLKPGSRQSLFDLQVSSAPGSRPSTELKLIRSNGEVWSVQ